MLSPGAGRRQQVTVDQVKLDEEGLHILLVSQCVMSGQCDCV